MTSHNIFIIEATENMKPHFKQIVDIIKNYVNNMQQQFGSGSQSYISLIVYRSLEDEKIEITPFTNDFNIILCEIDRIKPERGH